MWIKLLLDSDFLDLVKQLPAPAFGQSSLSKTRALFLERRGRQKLHRPDGLTVTQRHIPSSKGAAPIRALIYSPKRVGARLPGLLHIHGGGFVMGAPEMVAAADIQYATSVGAVVITPNYRLAPEWRYPSQIEDCYSVLLWMFQNADEIGVDPART